MEKKTQVLDLDPPIELVFKGPFTEVVTSYLRLTNPSNNPVVFKVKTTAPKQYCVRPNSGILQPHETSSISVMLQPFDASSTDRSKHKFMVQTMYAAPDFQTEQLDNIWKTAIKGQLMDSKLRCTFIEEEGSDSAAKPNTEEAAEDNETPVTTVTASEGEKDPLDSSAVETTPKADLPNQPTAGSTPAVTKADDKEKAQYESTLRVLQDKVNKLTSENDQLKNEGNKLRQRIATTPPTTSGGKVTGRPTHTTTPPHSSDSSPLNMIAIVLILLALLFGYFVGRWM